MGGVLGSEALQAGSEEASRSRQPPSSPVDQTCPHIRRARLWGIRAAGVPPPPGVHTFPIPGRRVCGESGPQDPLHHLADDCGVGDALRVWEARLGKKGVRRWFRWWNLRSSRISY